MSTVKYSNTEKLKEIQSRIFLLTNKQLTQQEILESSVEIVSENIDLLVEKMMSGTKNFSKEEIEKYRTKFSAWGPKTKDISSTIDETLYG